MKIPVLFSLAFVCTLPICSWAVDCLPVEVSLTTQQQIDNFQETYGGGGICDTVKGSLVFGAGDIVNLAGLSDIKVVTRNLWFSGTSVLPNVDGLSGLTTIGGELWLHDTETLTTLSGLSNLAVVGEKIDIWGNAELENLDGLSGLTYLTDSLVIIDNPALTNTDGLSNLSHVGNELNVQSNASLTTLGLSSLSRVEGGVLLIDNTALLHLDGLANLVHVGSTFEASYNTALSSCVGLLRLLDDVDDAEPGPGPGIAGVPDVGRSVRLLNNQTGCNLIDEITTMLRTGFESPLNTLSVLHDSDNSVGWANSIAIGADGNPIISYRDDTSGALIVAKCGTGTCTSALISVVDGPPNETATGTSIAIGADDLPIIAYDDRSTGVVKVAKCNDDACSGGEQTITTIDSGNVPTVAIGADGLPVIGYVASGVIKVAKCGNAACSGGAASISALNATGVKPSLVIGADGMPLIAYLQGGGSPADATVKVAKCNDPACAGADETISIVDVTSMIGFGADVAITIGANGFPAIAQYDPLADEIRIAVCNDLACSGADETITAIDHGGGSQELSIATGADGYPILSYRNGYFGALMAAKCNNFNCSISSINMIDHLGDLAASTCIAIGDDGLPIISYTDSATKALRVAHCGMSSCRK